VFLILTSTHPLFLHPLPLFLHPLFIIIIHNNRLRATFLKLSSILSLPLVRITQCGSAGT
jgi:hypothetical protein